ncbi:CPBP family intramembrane metalloprotease [Rhodococcus sp. G-MC3]|uniref:CPBP family intramembrane glutamic endopeptidase n=1 Tax=Rhodococcus sp. G-MC3 TaxID=3046209 RepID=UPI0024BAD423|nr:CPBP family intramembrane glutamic endopeptidase [Rhodococcus sp. G-MC3]MDJ0391933.1 CPBP family intramembrane metalloprotease [Rhodococcus sp. G-MC3]
MTFAESGPARRIAVQLVRNRADECGTPCGGGCVRDQRVPRQRTGDGLRIADVIVGVRLPTAIGFCVGRCRARRWTRPCPGGANRWVVLVVSAALFALWHWKGRRSMVLLCGGLAVRVARMRSGSVAASAIAHSVDNTLPALAILLAP